MNELDPESLSKVRTFDMILICGCYKSIYNKLFYDTM